MHTGLFLTLNKSIPPTDNVMNGSILTLNINIPHIGPTKDTTPDLAQQHAASVTCHHFTLNAIVDGIAPLDNNHDDGAQQGL